MGESLLDAAVEYAESGHLVFPIWAVRPDGTCQCPKPDCSSPGKHPQWRLAPNGLKDATDDVEIIRSWWQQYPNGNIGLCTGHTFFVIDGDQKEGIDGTAVFLRMAEQHGGLPKTATADTGGGGAHFLFAMQDEVDVRNQQNMLVDGERVTGVDVRGTGGYIIAPPSMHKSGKRYQWSERNLFDDLKAAPMWLLDIVGSPAHEIAPRMTPEALAVAEVGSPPIAAAAPPRGAPIAKTTCAPREVDETTTAQVIAALQVMSPSTDRQTWIERITMPLHDLFGGSDEGFKIWHDWCATGLGEMTPNGNPAYKSERESRSQWNSLNTRHRNPKGPATFWQYAQECGFTSSPPPPQNNGTAQPQFKPPPQFTDEEIAESLSGPTNPGAFPASVAMSLEGPIRDLITWIVDCSRRPDQTIALTAAMAIVAGAVSRRALGPGGSRCMLTLALLAPSGAGKDKPQECVKNLFAMFPNLQVGLFDDSPTHRTQLDELLLTSKGQALMLLDEYGTTLRRWLNLRDVASSSMSPTIRRLATHGMTTYQLAVVSRKHPSRMKHGQTWDDGIFAPSFSLVGFTTPGQFYDALSESSLVDGFLGRHIVIASQSMEKLRPPLTSSMEPPDSVIQWTENIQAVPVPKVAPKSVFGYAEVSGPPDTSPSDPLDVPWDSEAADASWSRLCSTIDDVAHDAIREDDDTRAAILRRLPGQIITVALIFACGEAEALAQAKVTSRHIDLAYRVCKWSADHLTWKLRMGIAHDDFSRAHMFACERIESLSPKRVYRSYFVKRTSTAPYIARIWALLVEDPRFVIEGKAVRLRIQPREEHE